MLYTAAFYDRFLQRSWYGFRPATLARLGRALQPIYVTICRVQVEAELEEYKKSGDKYLDRVDFLKRAELRQYEKERDERLGADIRTRGRL